MKRLILSLLFLVTPPLTRAGEPLRLANDEWPPFITAGEEQGIAERLVCEALERAGWSCSLQIEPWESVLDGIQTGAIDGIVAAWRDPEQEAYLLFSESYITSRIIAVVSSSVPADFLSSAGLAGLEVAMVSGYDYGDEAGQKTIASTVVTAPDFLAAMQAVRDGQADVALVDELVAMELVREGQVTGVVLTENVLSARNLHFAMSVKNPRALEVIGDFERGYQAMLADGTVNEILEVDWLATDFGHPGRTDIVLREGVSMDDLDHPSRTGSVYALGTSTYQYTDTTGTEDPRVNYQVGGKQHSSLQSAINSVFGKEIGCEHKEFSSEFDCTKLFKR